MEGLLFNQAVMASISVWFIQRLKAWARLPMVTEKTDMLNRILGTIMATLSASGILVATNWNGVEGTFTLVASGLTAGNIALFAWTVIKSQVIQEVVYRIVKNTQPIASKTGKHIGV